MPASITWHDYHRTHAHKHVIWAVVALKSSFTLRLHQRGIANAKVVELFPYSRPPSPSLHLLVTESVLRPTLRSLGRKKALDRMLTEIEMMFKWRWLGSNIFPYWKKKKKRKSCCFLMRFGERTQSLFYSYLLIEVTKRISSNNNIARVEL